MEEQWRPVVGFEGYYEVSDHGRVCSLHRRFPLIKTLQQSKHGYFTVSLKRDGAEKRDYVHILVLKAFDRLPAEGEQSRHLNGVKTDNRPANLKWGTRKQNAGDRIAHGTHPVGSRNGCSKLHERDIGAIRAAHESGFNNGQIARRYDVDRTAIQAILKRKTWTHV